MRSFEMELEAQQREIDRVRIESQQRLRSLLEAQDEQWGECGSRSWKERATNFAGLGRQEQPVATA